MNVKLVVAYDGSGFHGYQYQPGVRTVEGELRRALTKVFDECPKLYSAGRTDAGSHAVGQVVNFHMPVGRSLPLERLVTALNANLPEDVVVRQAKSVPDSFHARYSAISRWYTYVVVECERRPVFLRKFAWHVGKELDIISMRKAAKFLEGEHDVSAFCLDPARVTSKRKIFVVIISLLTANVITFDFVAPGFARGLIRGIVGSLVEVGLGRRSPEWIEELLEGYPKRAPYWAPACGLFLREVMYPEGI